MLARRARIPLLPIALTGLIFVAAQLAGCRDLVLPVLPLLLLVLSLLSGRYPGCEAIARLAERVAGRRRRAAAPAQRRPARPEAQLPAGGVLVALGLATGAPPLHA